MTTEHSGIAAIEAAIADMKQLPGVTSREQAQALFARGAIIAGMISGILHDYGRGLLHKQAIDACDEFGYMCGIMLGEGVERKQ